MYRSPPGAVQGSFILSPKSPNQALHTLTAHYGKADLGLLMLCKGILAPDRMHLVGSKLYKKRQGIIN